MILLEQDGLVQRNFRLFLRSLAKNNVLGHFLGLGYEKASKKHSIGFSILMDIYQLNFMHRFISRMAVLAINIHCIGYCTPHIPRSPILSI